MPFDLSNARFAFLDLETTGLSPWFGDRICEVGIVVCEGKRIKASYQQLVNPQRLLSAEAANVNGLNDAILARAPTFGEIAQAVLAHLQDAIVVCHNAQFDMQFLDSELRRLNHEIQVSNLIDPRFIAREHFNFRSNSLGNIAASFKIPAPNAHRALADALTDKAVFFAMMDALKPSGKNFEDFIGLYNSPAWPLDGTGVPKEIGEAIRGGRRLYITYLDKEGQQTERWVTPLQVLGISDYLYLRGYCHLRKSERNFRMDRILAMRVEIETSNGF